MKQSLAALLTLALCSCDVGQVGGHERYDQELREEAEVEKLSASVEVFQSARPDRAYEEIGIITIQTGRVGSENRKALQIEGARLHADAVIVTGSHQRNTFETFIPMTDAVAIKWKAAPKS